MQSVDSLGGREGIEPPVPVHLYLALSGPEAAGFSGEIYHQLSGDDARIELA